MITSRRYPPAMLVARRDFYTYMRTAAARNVVLAYVAIIAVTALILLVVIGSTAGGEASPDSGPRFFHTLAAVQLFMVVLLAPVTFAFGLVSERRNGIWDLVATTRLSFRQIVIGKFVPAFTFNLLLLASTAPFFSLSAFFSGVTLLSVVRMYVVLIATTTALGCLGLLVAFRSSPRGAMARSMAAALLFVVVTSALVLLVGDQTQFTIGSIDVKPQLSRVQVIDPLGALADAVRSTPSSDVLTRFSYVANPFGLPIALWQLYVVLCLLLTVCFLFLSGTRDATRMGLRQ